MNTVSAEEQNAADLRANGYCPGCTRHTWTVRGCNWCGMQPFLPSFAYQDAVLASENCPGCLYKNVQDLLSDDASPIEKMFWKACLKIRPVWWDQLMPQYPALRYRLDFALPEQKIGIELDGFATHSSTRAIAKDRQRQRSLEAHGWRIIRFGGSEIYHDAAGCVQQATELIKTWSTTSP